MTNFIEQREKVARMAKDIVDQLRPAIDIYLETLEPGYERRVEEIMRDERIGILRCLESLLSAPQDRDVGGTKQINLISPTFLNRIRDCADRKGLTYIGCQEALSRIVDLIDEELTELASTPPSVARIPDGLAKLLEDVAPTIHALRHYTTNDLKPGEMPGNILLLSDAVAVIALYDALSASPSPVVDVGRHGKEEKSDEGLVADAIAIIEAHHIKQFGTDRVAALRRLLIARIAIKDEARKEAATIANAEKNKWRKKYDECADNAERDTYYAQYSVAQNIELALRSLKGQP